jgi:hypothetical protein
LLEKSHLPHLPERFQLEDDEAVNRFQVPAFADDEWFEESSKWVTFHKVDLNNFEYSTLNP